MIEIYSRRARRELCETERAPRWGARFTVYYVIMRESGFRVEAAFLRVGVIEELERNKFAGGGYAHADMMPATTTETTDTETMPEMIILGMMLP